MTFLNPAILFGLLAVSIPVLIHLFNLKKVNRIEFSTLMFLKELQKTKLKRIKLLQLLLLLFRILFIAFLVLCFAKPVFKGYAGESSTLKTAVIFIDDSFSMSVKDERGAYLEQAKDAVKKILESHKETDEIYIVPVSTMGMKEKKIFYKDFSEITDSVKNLTPAYKQANMNEIVSYASDLLKNNKNLVREIYIISDFQKTNFPQAENTLKPENVKENTSLFLVNIGKRQANNLSIDNFKLKTKLLDKNRNITITAELTNHSIYNVLNKTVNLYVNGNKAGEKVFDAGSLSNKEVEFSFIPGKAGNITGYLELVQSEFQDDEISEDNKLYFSIYIPEEFKIAVLEDSPQNSRFIKLALSTATQVISDSSGSAASLNVQTISSINESIKQFDAVFIAGKRNFTEGEAQTLKDYVTSGGGMFIFPAQDIDVNNYNNVLLNKLNTAKINSVLTGNDNLKFERMDFEHPLLADIFQNEKLSITTENFSIESPKIRIYFDLLPNDNTSPLIMLNNNKSFIVESKVGEGKVLLSSVSASTDFSDFPLKSLFAPIIIRGVYYMASSYEPVKENLIGKDNIIMVKGLKSISTLTTPLNKSITLENLDTGSGYLSIPYENYSKLPGIYNVKDSALKNSYSFALNKNPGESPTEKLADNEIEKYFTNYGFSYIKQVENTDELKYVIVEARTGLDLWKYFLLLALVCIAAEYFIARKLEKGV